MELRQLRYFVAVAEHLSFRGAARALSMSQPPLSLQLRALERELGVRLLQRSSRHVELTRAGLLFLEEARLLLERARQAVRTARRDEDLSGAARRPDQLVLGFAPGTEMHLLPRVLRDFRRRMPDVRVHPRSMTAPEQLEGLANRRLDAGLLRLRKSSPTLQSYRIFQEPRLLALPGDHPLARLTRIPLRRLVDLPYIAFARPCLPGLREDFIGLQANRAGSFESQLEMNHLSNTLSLVAAGFGVSIVPASVQRIRIKGVRFRPVSDALPPDVIHVACRRDDLRPAVQAFLSIARAAGAAVETPTPKAASP